jgi:predicted secreted hydrolase
MDHQWGDFVTYQGGGWDWFAIQLDDGRDIMLYLIRDPSGRPAIFDGSIVAADGGLTVLEEGDFAIAPTGEWTSEATGTTYPSGWCVALPEHGLEMTVTPALPNQEVDSRPTTGVIYWEGAADVVGVEQGNPLSGNAYVELTGYAPYTPIDPATPLATVGGSPSPPTPSPIAMEEG